MNTGTYATMQLSSVRLLGNYMSLADHKGNQRGSLGTLISFQCICCEVVWLLLKYSITVCLHHPYIVY